MNATIIDKQRLILETQLELEELREAKKLIEKSGERKIYIGFSGGLMIEVTREEALEYIERKKLILKKFIDTLSKSKL